MGSFAIAQLFYISAFGFRPLKLWIGSLLYAGGVASECEIGSKNSSRMLRQILSFRSRLRSSRESRANNFDWSSDLYDAIGYHVLARRGTAVFAKGIKWPKSIGR